jgi:hypothetical protein
MGMIQRSNGLGFVLESIRKLRRQNFDRDNAVQARIGCPVHPTHAAGADFRIDDVWSKLLSGRKVNAG